MGERNRLFCPVTTEDDLIYASSECCLCDDQTELVNSVWFTFGRAYLAPEDHVPCVICTAAGERVGFIDLYNWRGVEPAYAWGYFIDARQQGKGYGRAAAQLAVRLLKAANPTVPLRLAGDFYTVFATKTGCLAQLSFQSAAGFTGGVRLFGENRQGVGRDWYFLQ